MKRFLVILHNQRIHPNSFFECAPAPFPNSFMSSCFAYPWHICRISALSRPSLCYGGTCKVFVQCFWLQWSLSSITPQDLDLRLHPTTSQSPVATDWIRSISHLQVHCFDLSGDYPAGLQRQGISPGHPQLLLLLHVHDHCRSLLHLLFLTDVSYSTKPNWHVLESAYGYAALCWVSAYGWSLQSPSNRIWCNPHSLHCSPGFPWPDVQKLHVFQPEHRALLQLYSTLCPIRLQIHNDLPAVVALQLGPLANLQPQSLLPALSCSNVSMPENQLWKHRWIKTSQLKSTMHCTLAHLPVHGKHLEMPLRL